MSFDSRNFFARGGEIYYLILSAGTRRDPELRTRIEAGLRDLLTTHNRALGELAGLIDRTWLDCYEEGEEPPGASMSKLGWIPDPDNPLYRRIAEDVATFLSADLDSMEAISLLAHLVCFHLAIYIYDRSDRVIEHLGFGEGERGVASPFLVDMLTASGDNTLRRVSATLFRAREARLKTCATQFIEARVMDWVSQLEGHTPTEEGIMKVDEKAVSFFGIKRLRKKSRASYEDAVNKLARQVRDGTATLEDVWARFSGILEDLLMSDFNKNFLPVHRTKLSKSIRFVAPRTGRGARFVLGDDLLKAITISAVRKDEMTFDAFLDTLYERYKIVVGARHAEISGLLEQQRINSEYYLRNREALLERMVHAGLAQEFSDATAMVRPASY
jgi:hypothetical protein